MGRGGNIHRSQFVFAVLSHKSRIKNTNMGHLVEKVCFVNWDEKEAYEHDGKPYIVTVLLGWEIPKNWTLLVKHIMGYGTTHTCTDVFLRLTN